ncbi:Alpha/Beta hydrolase protein [Mycena vulgaris]|nr:Alpha/Beta hydrolase protein [Mycena vulgaris]
MVSNFTQEARAIPGSLSATYMAPLYTEHTLKLPDGIEILYTDSGSPRTADYTTLVVLHGSGFNGYGFVRLHEYAQKYNLRIVLWNRRGYRGSTKYSDEELADMRAGRKIFQDRLALQTAWFLEHFIKHENTPAVTADRTAGGFVLAGWSSGVPVVLALFADPDVIPKPLYEVVEPRLRSLVLYDPPFTALAYPTPPVEGVYSPFRDPECTTPAQVYEKFKQWASSYYNHPDLASGSPSGLSFANCSEKRTISGWTEEEKETYCDGLAAFTADSLGYQPPMQATYKAQAYNALLNAKLVASFFPNVNVLYMSGEQTSYSCMWSHMESARLYKEALERGEIVRPTTFRLVPEGNHFLHYDAPEIFIREVVDGCAPK